ncbi:MAG: tetratricopeptide repeat protein, partial [Isosphaeraceae bacterium]
SFLILAVVGLAVSAILINHQRNEAVRQRNVSRRAVDDMYTQVAEKWLAQQPNLTALQQSFLEKALGYYEQFADEPVDGPEMQLGAARARGKVAAIHHKFGRVDEADRALRRSVEELDDLVARFPGRVEYRRELALKLYDLAALRLRVGRAGDAEAPSIRAVSIAEDLAALQPSVGEARCDLAFLLCKRGNVLHDLRRGVEAEAALRRSLDLFGTHVGTVAAGPRCRSKYAECSMTLGLVLVRKRDLPGAERAYREALRVQEALVKQVPDDPDVSYFPCVTLINLARAELVSGRSEEAIATFKASSDRLAALVDRFSDHRGYTSTLVVCLTDLFQILREVGSPEEAEGVGRRGVELAERLVREYPGVTLHSRELAGILYRLADFYSIPPDGHPIEPEKALELARQAAELEPENDMALQSLGWAKFRAGDMRGCIEALEKTSYLPKAGDFFASMACWHLGDRTRARNLFDQHSNWLDGYENRWNPGTYPSPAMLRRLQAEAAALLGVESPRVKAP